MAREITDSVTIHMDASPARVWQLVSDVTRIGRYSPETFEAQWLDGADGPALGARFRGHVKRNGKGPVYWTPCEVVECEPSTSFAFAVGSAAKPFNTWGYRIEPDGDGSKVTEWYRLPDQVAMRVYWALLGRLRARTNKEGMLATLEAIRRDSEDPDA